VSEDNPRSLESLSSIIDAEIERRKQVIAKLETRVASFDDTDPLSEETLDDIAQNIEKLNTAKVSLTRRLQQHEGYFGRVDQYLNVVGRNPDDQNAKQVQNLINNYQRLYQELQDIDTFGNMRGKIQEKATLDATVDDFQTNYEAYEFVSGYIYTLQSLVTERINRLQSLYGVYKLATEYANKTDLSNSQLKTYYSLVFYDSVTVRSYFKNLEKTYTDLIQLLDKKIKQTPSDEFQQLNSKFANLEAIRQQVEKIPQLAEDIKILQNDTQVETLQGEVRGLDERVKGIEAQLEADEPTAEDTEEQKTSALSQLLAPAGVVALLALLLSGLAVALPLFSPDDCDANCIAAATQNAVATSDAIDRQFANLNETLTVLESISGSIGDIDAQIAQLEAEQTEQLVDASLIQQTSQALAQTATADILLVTQNASATQAQIEANLRTQEAQQTDIAQSTVNAAISQTEAANRVSLLETAVEKTNVAGTAVAVNESTATQEAILSLTPAQTDTPTLTPSSTFTITPTPIPTPVEGAIVAPFGSDIDVYDAPCSTPVGETLNPSGDIILYAYTVEDNEVGEEVWLKVQIEPIENTDQFKWLLLVDGSQTTRRVTVVDSIGQRIQPDRFPAGPVADHNIPYEENTYCNDEES